MLSPKRTKFRKKQRSTLKGKVTSGNTIAFGDVAMVALERKWVTNRQIEAARIAITRHLKRGGKVWIRIFPDMPFTKKPAETRMGKGKGNPEYWVAVVKPGRVLFEIGGAERELSTSALRLAGSKLPIATRIVTRQGVE
jgi:large subunit ribosomal protein L16